MASDEDNEALTRVGPGTVMGDLMRQYWLPVLLSAELTDGVPLRVRLLGEDLVAFRGESLLGLIAEACPHRRASLYYGRIEPDGLRCAYHGWKFDSAGRCVDMPNEPTDCRFADKVRTVSYPCRERNGIIWAYLGPRTELPPLPEFEWNTQADNIPFFWRSLRYCNWLQALEGDIDSSHINWLHATFDEEDVSTVPGRSVPGFWQTGVRLLRADPAPRIEVVDTEYGCLYSARRDHDGEREYHRVHPFLFPFHTMVGGGTEGTEGSFNGKAWVPMDDERTLILEWQYRPGKAWEDGERANLAKVRNPWGFLPPTAEAGGAWRFRANRDNDYFLDRTLEKDRLSLGVLSNPLQDTAVQESMGAIVDRTKEHLGPADVMIIRVRKRLLAAARALRNNSAMPPGVDSPELYSVRPVGAILPKGADWHAATEDRRQVVKGRL